jgi:hypothetical protein
MVERDVDAIEVQGFEELYARQKSEDWIYGATPRFELKIGDSRLEILRGVVVRAEGPQCGLVEGKPFSEVGLRLLCPVD